MISQARIDELRRTDVPDQDMLIAGRVCAAESEERIVVDSPIDGRRLCHLASGGEADVDRAVQAARKAFDEGAWSRMPPSERKRVLLRFAELIEQHAEMLSVLGVRDNGTEIRMAYKAEPLSAARTFRYYAEAADKVYGEIAPTGERTLGLVHREPVGVVGAIIPWNFPLMIGAWKVAPALAAGNTVVLKPSEHAALSTLHASRLALEAGIPAGVLNVVTGKGSVVGRAMGLHHGIDVLAFTGGGRVGRLLHRYSAESNLKPLYLELGGKSPNIVFEDAPDIDATVDGIIGGMFRDAGQVCIAGTRLLLQESVADEVLARLAERAQALKVGDPLSLETEVGAIATERQLLSHLTFVEDALAEGASLVCGGERVNAESGGWYMAPTILADVTPVMRVAREEVFGPVLSVMRFRDEGEAVRLANDSIYGLAAGIWTGNLSRAHRMVKAIQAGVVHVNCYGGADVTVPLGGVKQSGNGKDKSLHALDKYVNLKTAWFQL